MIGVCYKHGLPADKVINLGGHTPEQIYKVIAGLPWKEMTVLGIGNVHGGGHEVAHYFEERSRA
jgi:hypothetical protein